MGDNFWYSFHDELAKVAVLGGLKAGASKLIGKLKKGTKWGGLLGLGALGYAAYQALKGVSEGHRELQQEGHL